MTSHQTPRRTARPFRLLLSLLAAVAALVIGAGSAMALPPGGASGNSPGTSSSVSPSTLKAGDYLHFRLVGFPAGSTASIKFDDGDTCSANAPQGACVVHQQVVGSNGVADGSFQIPKDIRSGKHTLRFLTAVYVDDNDHSKGSKGYSNKSPQFTISGVNNNAASNGSVSGSQIKVPTGNSGNSGAKSGSNSGSGSNGGSNGGSGSNAGSGSNDGSDSNGSGSSGQGGSTTQYVDENGNPISAEEAKKRQESGSGDTVQEVQEEVQEEEQSSDDASQKSDSTKSASASASASASQKNAEAQDASQNQSQGSDFPWIGVGAVVLVLIVAGIVLFRRHQANKVAGSSDQQAS